MWLFTKYGFYSVVRDKKDAERIQVRARVKDDIERLIVFARKKGTSDSLEVVSTPRADYAYRVVMKRSLWEQLAHQLTADIDYTNFKDAVHGEPDRDDVYLDVWATMSALQERRKKSSG